MHRFFFALLFTTAVASAQSTAFPGIKALMTPEEQRNSGVAELTADQLALIDIAIVRHFATAVRAEVNHQTAIIARQMREEEEKTLLSRFGLPNPFDDSWKDAPGIKARVTGWVGGNSFRLDNGQVWRGLTPIAGEIAGREIEIQPRRGGHFMLVVEGRSTAVHVVREK